MPSRPRSRRTVVAAPLVALAAVLPGVVHAFGPGEASSSAASAAPAAVRELERRGEELFGRNCQLCHNSRGKGGKGPPLVKGAWAPGGPNTDEMMFAIIRNGRPGTQMGGFGGSLDDDEIRTIIGFLRAESVRVKAAERRAVDADDVPW